MESGGYEFTAQHEITFPGNLYTRDSVSAPQNWELVFGDGVQRREDARNLTSLRARRRTPAETGRVRRRKFSAHTLAPIFVEVCDVARSRIRSAAKPRFIARLFGGRRSGATCSRT